jgi:hypothetical protein
MRVSNSEWSSFAIEELKHSPNSIRRGRDHMRLPNFEPVRGFNIECKTSAWPSRTLFAAIDHERKQWIVDAHRDNEKRFVARADEKIDGVFETPTSDSNIQVNLN